MNKSGRALNNKIKDKFRLLSATTTTTDVKLIDYLNYSLEKFVAEENESYLESTVTFKNKRNQEYHLRGVFARGRVGFHPTANYMYEIVYGEYVSSS